MINTIKRQLKKFNALRIKEYHLWIIPFSFIFIFCLSSHIFFSSENQLKKFLIHDNCIKQALFPTKDNITQILLDLINNEKKSIKACMFLLTDKKIAQALVEAKNRSIDVQIVACHTCIESNAGKVKLLQQANIPTYIFNSKSNKQFGSPIMHNKFFIFEQNIDNKEILWTGSFNFTLSAQTRNRENVLILDDAYLLQLYKKEFEDLKNESVLTKKIKVHKDKRFDFLGKILRALNLA